MNMSPRTVRVPDDAAFAVVLEPAEIVALKCSPPS